MKAVAHGMALPATLRLRCDASLGRSLDIRRRLQGPAHLETIRGMNHLGSALEALGRTDEAKKLYEDAVRLSREALRSENHVYSASLNNLGLLLSQRGTMESLQRAEPLLRKALEVRQR